MNPKKILIPLMILVGIAILAVAWYLGSPLFLNRTVNEEFPSASASQVETEPISNDVGMAESSLTATPMPAGQEQDLKSDRMTEEATPTEESMSDTMPDPTQTAAQETQLLLQGQFQDADSFHRGSGQASIYRLSDGSFTLRLDDFEVTNGPDLHVLLASNPTPSDSDSLGEYIDLGELKGNLGSQNYEVPADIDPQAYQSVVVYCLPFHVVFSIAPLGT